ncbi:acyl carrier protein phosphodiesterase [Nibrella viscosa]|uniref:Acyl carrier protein phosphodiesterase n=1 Tax=Nibrella viscosa TaxID=1084524 RepID=A0ABP8KKU9_9BACT
MNILAHAYLSGRHESLIVGNFIADFIKGNPANPRHGLTADEQAGVWLHRAIDEYTDAHAQVAAVRQLLYPRCHKYAGVAVDIFFDHFLALNLKASPVDSLSEFRTFVYDVLQRHWDRLPPGADRMAEAMIRYDWLSHYQSTEGIDRSLKGLSRRTAFPSGLDTAIDDFNVYYAFIGQCFERFWPQLAAFARERLVSLPGFA